MWPFVSMDFHEAKQQEQLDLISFLKRSLSCLLAARGLQKLLLQRTGKALCKGSCHVIAVPE